MAATPKALSAAEEKDLRRVFATLAQFQRRARLEARTAQLREQRGRMVDQLRGAQLEAEIEAARREQGEVGREHEGLEAEQSRKIKAGDIFECLRTLGRSASRKEVEDMIWEVDENLDGMVDWDELRLTYQRNVADTSGLEPCQLFHLLQFLMYDKDGSGKVTVDETLHMLYARYGRDKLEGVRLDCCLGFCVLACRRSAQSARPLGPLAKARPKARPLTRPLICPLTHARSLTR
jgi:Ca2+-binding EF-hand superfamily protein